MKCVYTGTVNQSIKTLMSPVRKVQPAHESGIGYKSKNTVLEHLLTRNIIH